MKIENLELAVSLKERRDVLIAAKNMIEQWPETVVSIRLAPNEDVKMKDSSLNILIRNYCKETIKIIEEEIKRL